MCLFIHELAGNEWQPTSNRLSGHALTDMIQKKRQGQMRMEREKRKKGSIRTTRRLARAINQSISLSTLLQLGVNLLLLQLGRVLSHTRIATRIQRLEAGNHGLEVALAVLSEARDLGNVSGRHVVDVLAVVAQLGNGARRHGEAHVLGPVDELEDGRRRLVLLDRLDAQDAGVSSWAIGVAFSQRTEEFGDQGVWFLCEGKKKKCQRGVFRRTDGGLVVGCIAYIEYC